MGSKSNLYRWTEEDERNIYKLYNVNYDDIQKQVSHLVQWYKSQPHLPTARYGDINIESIFLHNKFKVERTKQSLSNYFMLVTMFPDFFKQHPNTPKMLATTEAFYFTPLPRLTPDYKRVMYFKMKANRASQFDPTTFMAYIINIYQVRSREDCRYQDVHVYDLQDFTVEHLMKFSPAVLKKMSFVFEKMYDGALSSLNFLNVASYVESFVNILKSIIKNKVRDRVHVHRNVETLYKIVPKEILPKDYGGAGESLDELEEMWRTKFVEYDEVFKMLSEINVDMDLLPEKLKMDDYWGVHGNFRKLDVD